MNIRLSAQEFKAIISCCAKNDIRYYLDGFMLDRENRRIVSTDGHRMLMLELGDHVTGILPVENVILERPSVLPKQNELVNIELNPSGQWFIEYVGKAVTRFEVKTIDATYPNYTQVIPTAPEPVDSIGFNPVLFADICKALKICGVRVKFHGVTGSMIVEFSGFKHISAVIMPMRTNDFDKD